mgnify:CR=1 FL=1
MSVNKNIRPFHTVLVANRGEIALRVLRTVRRLGYGSVAVYSEADRHSPHVGAADRAVCIGPAAPAQSYLNIDAIIAAARLAGADAVHPGYGFLSENDAFADAVDAAGLVFIGPSGDNIRAMGNKAGAKRLMQAAGMPCIPGYEDQDQSDETFVREAERIGFPIMCKAAAGGGGRGMRLVQQASDLPAALASARSEARTAFGSAELILERAVVAPRHVEIQLLADSHGHVVHLGERDCSVQRRHQKVIEEAPSPAVDAALRQRMGEAAVHSARTLGYIGAGTMEFLLDAEGHFYFMEMNTRLQVEHAVTEAITGLDLVEWQLRVASGEPLPLAQDQICIQGHAIEARICAENPDNNFLPATGTLQVYRKPQATGFERGTVRVRVDGLQPTVKAYAQVKAVEPVVDVSSIVVDGVTQVSAEELQTAVQPWVGKALTVAQLQEPARAVTDLLKSKGLSLAQAFVPAQDLQKGQLRVQVVEGVLDATTGVSGVVVKGVQRTDPAVVARTIAPGAVAGQPLRAAELEQRLILANELPGLKLKASLVPGAKFGTTVVEVTAEEELSKSIQLYADNHGNRYTGQTRVGADLDFYSPSGKGDQISLGGVASKDSGSVKLAWSLPVAFKDARVGASFADSQSNMTPQNINVRFDGQSQQLSFFGQLPLVRRTDASVTAQMSVDNKKLSNDFEGM